MSLCCGGCGGEESTDIKKDAADQTLEAVANENDVPKNTSEKKAEVETWQPAKK